MMYTVLASEIADVDEGLYRRVGHFSTKPLRVLPITGQVFAIKSIRSRGIDATHQDCQNTLFVSINLGEAKEEPLEDWMNPGPVYERDGDYYVELRYDYELGLINLTMFFLVLIKDCEFYFQDDDNWNLATFEQLQKSGHYVFSGGFRHL